eukprot:TRINITY_DN57798_c0_g1_i1.p1 TRINITY_DN57798_c0_g1~~TRINITY_DN57798_c0_g1_i1.p1  ORF type:complete len:96 (-),score=7.75 TRINITY_DN57798_c0_g1_i1:136-396(-)
MGFLTGLIFDAVTITTVFGGIKRYLGFSAGDFLKHKITNEGLRAFVVGYFKIGDVIVFSTESLIKNIQSKKIEPRNDKDKDRKDRD